MLMDQKESGISFLTKEKHEDTIFYIGPIQAQW